MIDQLDSLTESLKDPASETADQPAYIDGITRAIDPEFMVVVGLCTHLGCAPKFRPEVGTVDTSDGSEWVGGFFCPCHGSMFDLAGRVFGGPAPTNLRVPPHRFVNETTILVGVDTGNA